MSILIDVLLIAIFVLVCVFFFKYGVIKSLMRLGKVFLSMLCSLALGPWVSGRLEDLFFRNAITNGTYNSLINILEKSDTGYNLQLLFERLPQEFNNFLNSLGVGLESLKAEYGQVTEATDVVLHGMAEKIATPVIGIVSSIIGGVVCFVVPLIFFWYLNKKNEEAKKSAVIRFFDKAGGVITGIIVGYCVVVGVVFLLFIIFQIIVAFNSHSQVMEVYNNSFIFKFLNEFDIFKGFQSLKAYLTGLIG